MGLDIYLYRYNEDVASVLDDEREEDAARNAIWEEAGDYKSLTDEQKEQLRERVKRLEAGFDIESKRTHISEDWPDDPEHICKVGYLRSSYNEASIDAVLRHVLGTSLDVIFGNDSQTYIFQPDWAESRRRAETALTDLEAADPLRATAFDALQIFGDPQRPTTTAAEAIEKTKKVLAVEHGPDFRSFSNSDGDFFLDGFKILAAIPGKSTLGVPCVWAIYRMSEEVMTHYYNTLRIAIATCDYVLSSDDPSAFRFHWSG